MDDYCDSCTDVAQRLAKLLDTRCRGQPFKTESSEPILAKFGTIAEITSKATTPGCPSCRDLKKELTRWEKVDDRSFIPLDRYIIAIEITEVDHEKNLYGEPPRQQLYVVARDTTEGQYSRSHLVNFYPMERGAPNDQIGRLFDTQEIDLGLIKSWLQCCDLTHGKHCSLGLTERLPENILPAHILLVDLENRCLSRGTLSDKYATLSYVWGEVDRNTIKTTRSNVSDLMKPGGIDFTRPDLNIPQTIRDLMRLAVQIDIRYVWVDSICIVQDGEDLQEQLDGMAAIYSSAYLTVIVDGPNANIGLPGIGNGAKPRNTLFHELRLPGMTCIFTDNHDSSAKYSAWTKRAWTFQEGLFSCRHLFFDVPGNITWGCQSQYWFERYEDPSEKLEWVDTHGVNRLSDWAYYGFSDINFQWPDMRRWCGLIQEYCSSGRKLSYDCDAINAIAGLINVMEHVCVGGFFFGTPELFFDIYLLWDISLEEDSSESVPRRRQCQKIPSWSFLGWKDCSLDLFWWSNSMDYCYLQHSGFMYERYSSDCEVGSILKWFKQVQGSNTLVPIANQYHVCRSQWAQEPPEGWSKQQTEGKKYYTHESLEDCEFRYPIALPKNNATEKRVAKEHFSHYLYFKAKRGWLNIGTAVGKDPNEKYADLEFTTVSLVNDEGQWAGAIRIPFIQSAEIETLPDGVAKDMRFELIAIATGKIRNTTYPYNKYLLYVIPPRIPEWHCEGRRKEAEFYEFYFVLWIEWEDGVAYRKGLGRVEKWAWEQLSTEEIDVKLG